MKAFLIFHPSRFWRLGFFILALGFFAVLPVRAGLTVDIHLYHDTFGYYFYPWLTANNAAPNFPDGNYQIASPQIPTGGSQLQYQATNNTLNFITGGGNYYGDFDSFLYGITNGQWSIFVTNSTSTNQYKFTVTVTDLTSNSFGAPVVAVFPLTGSVNVTNQPLFSWTGPANWAGTLYVQDNFIDTNGNNNYETSANLPANQTTWPCPIVLPDGTNSFSVSYTSNVTVQVVASTPLNNLAQPISGWISTATLETDFTYDSLFTVGMPVSGTSGGHALVAHYTFDSSGDLGQDSSGNGNDMPGETYWGPQHVFDADAETGGGAIQFFGADAIHPYPASQALTNLNAVLAGSFTFSTWVKTTVAKGTDGNNAFFGAVIFWAYNDDNGNTNDTIPLSITGSKVAFTTRDHLGNFNTLHSNTSVNDGNYHLITVTRDQATGEKKIYVDGNFETSEIGTTDPLNGNNYNLDIGGNAYESDGTGTNFYAYSGLLDDFQIYSGVLSASDVANLYANPGSTVANVTGFSGGHTNLAYYSFEDNNIFAHDFSGHNNNINSFGDYAIPPYITNDAEAGSYAFGAAGDGWLFPPTNLLSTLAGSFSVALWLKTSDTNGNDDDDEYSAAGIVSAFNGTGNDVMPMGLNGSKLGFYTGGSSQDILHSQTSINTGEYVHLVVTRNQATGEKKIYVNGVLDASDFGSTDLLVGTDGITIGFNNGQAFAGEMDEIQFYSGVLSPTEVATLHNNPGTAIPDVAGSATSGLIVHYDFDEGNVVAPDVSGNGNNILIASNIDDYDGDNPMISTDSIAGAGSVNFDGESFLAASTNLLPTIAGTFSLSLWVKTKDDSGSAGEVAWGGASIVSADVPNSPVNGDIIPVALTGGEVAFNTGSPNGDDTINSQALVNDGQWHHIVVMRNQPTGEKDIYVDGQLDTSDFDTTNLLNDPKILTIGCKADASNSDPDSPSYTGSDGYTGLVDDIQLYNRILSPDEVSYLFNNPGATAGSGTFTPYPVDVSLHLTVQRSQDPNLGQYFSAGVSFDSVSPAATTTNSVYSPNSYYSTQTYPSGGSGSSTISSSLGDVLNEITNGSWKIYINQGSPTQEVYSFQVSISGLDTNLLAATKILFPTNGSAGVLPNASFYWNGPTNFSTLNVGLFTGPDSDISLPLTTTNWTPSQAMTNGSQTFFTSYNSNNFPNITFTTPVDASLNPIHSWNATAMLNSEAFSSFVVYGPTSVRLLNLKDAGGNFNFSFTSQTGFTNAVQYRTNLVVGTWQTYSKITGDGTVKNVSVPLSVFNGSKQGFVRVSTQ